MAKEPPAGRKIPPPESNQQLAVSP
jgi:hypothetical protein